MSAWTGMILDGIARVIVKAVNAANKTQIWTVEGEAPSDEDGEDLAEVESFQHFGFASHPALGAEAITVNVGADSAHAVVIASQHKDYQPRGLAEGEVCLYTKDGKKVHCKADGITYVGDSPTDFTANATKVDAEIARIWDVLTTWTVAPNDGGAALQTAANTASAGVESVACTQLKAK